jgi:DNA-binding GntR family transcriptional regulator
MTAHPNPADLAQHDSRIGSTHSPLRDIVAKTIREWILSGRFKPGERLVEEKLAVELGISRNPVREAIRSLASEGLLVVTPRRGASVAAPSRIDAWEMVEVRAVLEGMNARLAARHRPPEFIQQLKAVLAEGRAKAADGSGTIAEFVALNARYHDLLAASGANRILGDIIRMLRDRTSQAFDPLSIAHAAESWEEHAAILQAVITGDEDMAELLASRHVLRAGRTFLMEQYPDESSSGSGAPPAPRTDGT